MIKKYLLFTTPTCPNCIEVEAFTRGVKMKGEHIDASTDEGRRRASENSVMSVPLIIFLDENEKEAGRANTIDEIKRILH